MQAWRSMGMLGLLTLTACDQAPHAGLVAVEQLGCGSCHVIPGVAWPRNTVGPTLEGYAERAFIAGKLPNKPENLIAFILDATRFVPDGAMPPIAMTDQEARDIATYLYTLEAR